MPKTDQNELLGRIDERQKAMKDDIGEIKDAVNQLAAKDYRQGMLIEKIHTGLNNHLATHDRNERSNTRRTRALVGILGGVCTLTAALIGNILS